MAIYTGLLAGAATTFASPTIAVVALLALIQGLQAAETAAGTKARGLAKVRDSKRDLLWSALESLRAYVQTQADLLVPAAAIVLIESAGFIVAEIAVHDKPILEALLVPASAGTVRLVANASLLVGSSKAKTQFNWQMSLDGKTWTNLPSTPLATTEVTGLTPLTAYWFRVNVTLGKVTGAWTQAVTVTTIH
jgi:hypothetical protein